MRRPAAVKLSPLRSACVTLLLASLAACGGTPPLSGPALPAGARPAQAAQTLAEGGRYPAAMAVCASENGIEAHAAGQRALGAAEVAATSRFPLGSLTKAYTATLAALLVQQGRIQWGTKVFGLFPELAAQSQPAYAVVSLRDLLAHRGGIPEFKEDDALEQITGDLASQRRQFAQWVLRQPPSAAPLTETRYSNAGFLLAAAMLEAAAGQPYEALVQQALMQPLGMEAAFGVAGEMPGTDVHGHVAAGAGWAVQPASAARQAFPEALNPIGLMLASAPDWGRFLQLHLNAELGQGGLVLSPEQAQILHTPVQDRAALGWLDPADPADASLRVHNGTDGRSYFALMALSREQRRACAVAVTGFRAEAGVTPTDAKQAVLALLGRSWP